jgi:predicted O-methyltransferase YrrM
MEYNLDELWEGATKKKIQQIREEWEWLISKVAQKGKEQNILEIGCYDGGSSWYLNHFASRMITIDNNDPCRFIPSELGAGYSYIGGDSHDPRVLARVVAEECDFVFIDGDHSYEGVKADFYNLVHRLKPNTLVAFHDIVISDFHHQHGCYVGEFWRDLKNEYKAAKFEEYSTNPEWAGIGILWT